MPLVSLRKYLDKNPAYDSFDKIEYNGHTFLVIQGKNRIIVHLHHGFYLRQSLYDEGLKNTARVSVLPLKQQF